MLFDISFENTKTQIAAQATQGILQSSTPHSMRGRRPDDLRVKARRRIDAVLSAGRAVLAGSR